MADAAAIERLEAQWADALFTGDFDALETLLAPEFRLVGVRSTGSQDMTRDAWFHGAREMVFHQFEAKTLAVEVYGDAAIASVGGYWRLDWGSRRIDERFLVTDVWIRRDGRWQVVRRHSSPYQSSGN